MTTRVVNMRDHRFDVYIGRKGHGHDGFHGNPIIIGQMCPVCGNIHNSRGTTLPCFKHYLLHRLAIDRVFAARTLLLQGQVLGCFCKPDDCHGDVIAEVVDSCPPTYVIGFTGTRNGMTEAQYVTVDRIVRGVVTSLPGTTIIALHGDCIGADHHFDHVCERAGIVRLKYPSNIRRTQAHTGALAIDEQTLPFGKTRMIFDGVPQAQLAPLGETGIPGLADLFVATMKGTYA